MSKKIQVYSQPCWYWWSRIIILDIIILLLWRQNTWWPSIKILGLVVEILKILIL